MTRVVYCSIRPAPGADMRGSGGPAVGRADEDGEQDDEVHGAGGIVRVTRGLQRADPIEPHSVPLQDVSEGQQRQAGVAVRKGMEEGNVEVGPGRASGQGDLPVAALAQTSGKVLPRTRRQCVAFPAALGEGVALTEGSPGHAEDKPLPFSQKGEGEGALAGGTGAGPGRRPAADRGRQVGASSESRAVVFLRNGLGQDN